MSPAGGAREVDERLRRSLLAAADDSWREFRDRRGPLFHPFVPSDHEGGYHALVELLGERPDAERFVELGSGIGVMTIFAALLGLEATGIEVDPWLHERSTELAERFDAEDATFVHGSFVPAAFQPIVDRTAPELLTMADGVDAWDELGEELADFDVVFAFPWPDQEELLERLVRRHARPDAVYLTYDGSEGWRARPAG
jgi:predicted O-methyltransferase YrrM